MIRLPDGRDRMASVIADPLLPLAVAGVELPEAGPEVGACEHGVCDQADEDHDEGYLGQRHAALSSGSGAAASRRSTHQTATARPAYMTASAP